MHELLKDELDELERMVVKSLPYEAGVIGRVFAMAHRSIELEARVLELEIGIGCDAGIRYVVDLVEKKLLETNLLPLNTDHFHFWVHDWEKIKKDLGISQ